MTSKMRVTDEQASKQNIVSGPIGITIEETDVDSMEE